MKGLRESAKKNIILLMVLTNLVFLVLYAVFIFGNGIYMYADVGSDSLSSSYPIMALLSRMLHSLNFSSFNLEFGVGNDITATSLQYLNPLKFLTILFTRNSLPYGILLILFLEVNLLSAFGYGYFKRLLGNENAAVFPALAWTFTGYTVIWGQNYSYFICILLFTAVMFFLQGFLMSPSPSDVLLLTLSLALFLISNFYFFYMTGMFSACYTLIYLLLKKTRFRDILKKLLLLLLAGILACGAGAVSLIPVISSMLGSSRAGNITSSIGSSLHLFDHLELYSMLSRFFSNDLLGTANAWSGSLNYYEIAFLFVSTLFFFSAVYLVFRRRSGIPVLLLTFLSVAALIIPLTGRLLNFEAQSHRWTFMICFLEAAAIGFFVKSLLESFDRRALVFSLIFTPLAIGTGYFLLYRGMTHFNYSFSESAVMISLSFAAAYFVLLLLILKKKYLSRILYLLLISVLAAECIFANYSGINSRDYLTKEDWEKSYYNDGTQNAVSEIQKNDTDLYRISAGTAYDFANEGMVDGFYSTNVYSNMNQAYLPAISGTYFTPQLSSNFFLLGYSNFTLFTLLSGRYLISDDNSVFTNGTESTLFENIGSAGGKAILKNRCALPFGYLYRNETSLSSFSALSGVKRTHAIASSFFYTDGMPEGADKISGHYSAYEESDTDRTTLLNIKIAYTNNVAVQISDDGVTLQPTGPDPYIFIDIPENSEDPARFLELTVDMQRSPGFFNFELYSMTKEYETYGDELYQPFQLNPMYPSACFLLEDHLKGLRIDIPAETESVSFSRFALVETDTLADDFRALQDTDATGISFQNNTYRATVDAGEDGGMFCVPLIYQKGWTALVNGKETKIANINGGLIGIALPSGTSDIKLTYHLPHLEAGIVLSAIFLLLILFIYRRYLSIYRKTHPVSRCAEKNPQN